MPKEVKKEKSDILFILPPQWTPLSIYYALPLLVGELKANGYNASIRDLNVEFYDSILSREHLNWCRQAVERRLESLKKDYYNDLAERGVAVFDGQKEDLYSEIEGKLEQVDIFWNSTVANIEKAKKILKNKSEFYDPKNLQWAFEILIKALEIASLPYYPSKIMLRDYVNRNCKMTIESIMDYVKNENENPFLKFYDETMASIEEQSPKMVGISINSFSQVLGGLTLARKIKQKMPQTHVSLGGNFFTRIVDTLVKHPEFFEEFCHTLTYEEGEIPIVALAKAISGKSSFENVPNLIYKNQDGKVIVNPVCCPKSLNDIANPDFSGLDTSLYLAPEIVFPIQASRGCYWKKCTFCDHDYGVEYKLKSPKKLVAEMTHLKENYGIEHFEFIDESISPSYLKKMSDEIILNGLDVKWFIYARTEKGFSKELMSLAKKAGCTMIMWGVESGSDRIMELINKGIEIDKRFVPLENANAAGIWNFCFVFFGFPTETSQEALMTINMIMDNKDIINSYGPSIFTLGKHTHIRENPENFGIKNIREDEEELSTALHYDIEEGMTPEQVQKSVQLCEAISEKIYFSPLWFSIGFREFLHLYLDRFGFDYVKDFSYKND